MSVINNEHVVKRFFENREGGADFQRNILSFMDFRAKYSLSCASKKCNASVKQAWPLALRFLNNLDLSYDEKLTNNGLKLLENALHLKTLNLTGCSRISKRGIVILNTVASNIEKLNLSKTSWTDTDTLEYIINRFENLQSLSMENCPEIKGELYTQKATKLEVLSLAGCRGIKDIQFGKNSNLHRLNLNECSGISKLGSLEDLQLTHLSFRKLANEQILGMRGEEFGVIPKIANTLQSLDLSYSYANDQTIQQIATCQKLTRLCLNGCFFIKDISPISQKLTQLKELGLGQCFIENPEELKYLTNLVALNTPYNDVAKHIKEIVSQCGKLKKLALFDISIKSDHIQSLSKLSQLERLHLYTGFVVKDLESLQSLRYLETIDRDFSKIFKTLPQLQGYGFFDLQKGRVAHIPRDFCLGKLDNLKLKTSRFLSGMDTTIQIVFKQFLVINLLCFAGYVCYQKAYQGSDITIKDAAPLLLLIALRMTLPFAAKLANRIDSAQFTWLLKQKMAYRIDEEIPF